MFIQIRDIFHFVTAIDAYDKNGNFKYLLGRESKKNKCLLKNIPTDITEKTLDIICESFDIPIIQKYCLRLDDSFMDIYESFNYGVADHMEFERLTENVLDYIYSDKFEQLCFDDIKTVEDLIRALS